VFARVITAESAPESLAGVVQVSQQQLGAAKGQRGFKGFYLLTDRETGKLMTISLWESLEDAQVVEGRAAPIRDEAATSMSLSTTPTLAVYEVAVHS